MRIRKNARVLVEANKTSFLICKLNRSPWDDDSLISQLEQEDWDNNLPLNGSLAHSNHASDSNPSGDSMELSFEYIEKREVSPPEVIVAKLEEEEGKQIEGDVEAKTTPLCTKKVRKQACDNEVKFLSPPLASNNKVVLPPPPPPPQPPLIPAPPPPKKRGRPKKPRPAVAGVADGGGGGNPYEFYYYSGFGPSWSKKRNTGNNNNNKINENNNNNNTKNNKNAMKNHDNYNVARTTSSLTMNGDAMEVYDNGNTTKNKIGVVETVFDEQLDYIDDDEEEDGGLYGVDGVRIRPRKPIKARSLKSLM